MLRATATLSCFAIATTLHAQGEPSTEEARLRAAREIIELLADPQARAARGHAVARQMRLSAAPKTSTSAVVVMPVSGEILRLRVVNDRLELRRTGADGGDVVCGSWPARMGGPFTARAFGPNDLVVAMSTGNASPETAVLQFARADAAGDFAVAAEAFVAGVTWRDTGASDERTEGPAGGEPIAWHAPSRTVSMAFAWEGLPRVVVADVVLASTAPAAPAAATPGRRTRLAVLHGHPKSTVKGELLGIGLGVEALDVDGELHVFLRCPSGHGRDDALRVRVRDRAGAWGPVLVPDVRIEGEFVAWRDAEGRVCLTTPISDVREAAAARPAVLELFQTLATFRMAAQDASQWTLAPRQCVWSGALRLGQRLQVVRAASPKPAVVLQTEAGEVLEQPLLAPETPRAK